MYQWELLPADCHAKANETMYVYMDENKTWVGNEDRLHRHLRRYELIPDYDLWSLTDVLETGCRQALLLSENYARGTVLPERDEDETGHQRFRCVVHLERERELCHFSLHAIDEETHDLGR